MLDFTELPQDGNAFELLIRELLFSRGLRVFWSGKGPDRGRDLIAIEEPESELRPTVRRWLVQCKHFAHAGRAVGITDLDNIVDSCAQHDASGYVLACSTYPSSTVVDRLEQITANPKLGVVAIYWDAAIIERKLSSPRSWPIAQRFFPKSASADDIRLYATEQPNHWVVNYRGFFFHLHNRIGTRAEWYFPSLRARIRDLEALRLPEKHLLRPRAVSYDDKNGNFHWSIDYLYPKDEEPAASGDAIARTLGDGYALEDGQYYSFDVHLYPYNEASDYNDPDYHTYYEPFLYYFTSGMPRPKQYTVVVRGRRQDVAGCLV